MGLASRLFLCNPRRYSHPLLWDLVVLCPVCLVVRSPDLPVEVLMSKLLFLEEDRDLFVSRTQAALGMPDGWQGGLLAAVSISML
jgi:hypothetical protein